MIILGVLLYRRRMLWMLMGGCRIIGGRVRGRKDKREKRGGRRGKEGRKEEGGGRRE